MKVSREKATENRRRIVHAASRLFRERGIKGTGVDSISAAADLTHGANVQPVWFEGGDRGRGFTICACRFEACLAAPVGKKGSQDSANRNRTGLSFGTSSR